MCGPWKPVTPPTYRTPRSVEDRAAAAQAEQTDYGHPGRFNAWEPRGIDTRLQARTNELRAVCEALAPLLR